MSHSVRDQSVFTACDVEQSSTSMRRNELASWAERLRNDSEFQTDWPLTLKAFNNAKNASAMRYWQ